MLVIGILCGLGTWALIVTQDLDYKISYASQGLSGIACVLFLVHTVALPMAPLPDDRDLTRIVLAFNSAPVLVDTVCRSLSLDSLGVGASNFCDGRHVPHEHCIWNAGLSCYYLGCQFVFYVGTIYAFFRQTAVDMQKTMWDTIAIYMFLGIPAKLVDILVGLVRFGGTTQHYFLVANIVAFMVARTPAIRQAVHARLGRSDVTAAAASIAGLMCEHSPQSVLQQAKHRFRCIAVERMDFQEMLLSPTRERPEAHLLEKTMAVSLGECDAFVSHSWHDCAAAKWSVLQSWRVSFKQEYGREPLVWFDKYCIDQSDLEADLRCLPIFLSGCRSLLVLCGKTYLSRLWCIVELFTFVQMGGCHEQIRLVKVLEEGYEEEDTQAISQAFEEFDAAKCTCFDKNDKARMLTIIQAAFGDMNGFNTVVRRIMDKAVRQHPEMAHSEETTSTCCEESSMTETE